MDTYEAWLRVAFEVLPVGDLRDVDTEAVVREHMEAGDDEDN